MSIKNIAYLGPGGFDYTFDPTPQEKAINDIVNQWLDDLSDIPSQSWGKKFFDAANKVVEAEQNLNDSLSTLDHLLEQQLSSDPNTALSQLKEIGKASQIANFNIYFLNAHINIAQAIRKNKPWALFRNVEIEKSIENVSNTYLKPIQKDWIGRYKQYITNVDKQINCTIYQTKAYIYLSTPWPEFNGIRDAIFKAGTSEAERAVLLEQLEKAKEQICLREEETFTAFPYLSEEQRAILKTVSDNTKTSCNVAFQDAQFYSKSIEENAKEIQFLRNQSNQNDYLHYASLFARKLFTEETPSSCAIFAANWMEKADWETPITNILDMGGIYLAALQKQNKESSEFSPPDSKFYDNFNDWLEKHPEFHMTPEILSCRESTDQQTDAEKLLLMQGYLALSQNKEPSYQEMQCYRMCDQLSPSIDWKIKEGQFHVSCLEFSASRELISSLPPENTIYLKQIHSWAQYRCACVALDTATFVLQQVANHVQKGKVRTVLQCGSATTQLLSVFLTTPFLLKYSLPYISRLTGGRFIDYADELARYPNFANDAFPWLELFYFSRMVVPPITRSVPIRWQERLHLNTAVPIATEGVMVLGPVITGIGNASFFSLCSTVMQVGISGISLVCLTYQHNGKRPSPTFRALSETAGSITTTFFPISLLGRSKDVIAWAAKKFLPKLIPATGFISTGIEVIQIGSQGAIVLHESVKKYPLRKQAHFLTDVQNQWLLGDYQKGKAVLEAARVDSDRILPLSRKYSACLQFFKLFHRLEETPESRTKLAIEIVKVNRILENLKQDNAYESAYNNLFIIKIKAFIKCGEQKKANDALIQEEPTDSLKEQLILSLVAEVKGLIDQQEYDVALERLELFLGNNLFQNYQELLKKFKEYITARKNANLITAETPANTISRLIELLDELTNKLVGAAFFNSDITPLHQEKVSVYLSAKKYKEANEILDSWLTSSRAYARTAEHLIRSGWKIGASRNYREAYQYLHEISEGLKNDNMSALNLAATYFLCKDEYSGPNPSEARASALKVSGQQYPV